MAKFGPEWEIGTVSHEQVVVAVPVPEVESEVLEGLEEGEAFGDGIPFGDPYWYSSDWNSSHYKESHRKVRAVMRNWVEKHAMVFAYLLTPAILSRL